MIFPEGLTFDTTTATFGTSTISPLYTYAPNKNDLSMKDKSSLVTHLGGTWNAVIEDLIRLSELLDDEESGNV